MVVKARLFCTEARCAAIYEAVGRLEELEALACSCGAGLEIVGWPEPDERGRRSDGFELLPLAA
ncbi:MAG: hypothetical protein ACJ76Z_03810 [Thermoleophilaceae bacterium]